MNKYTESPQPSQRMPVFATNVVATSQPLAAQAGLQMLQCGGNAIDAALATAITLTVVEPTANGIGSDAFAIIWDGQKLHGINGSGRSPKAWRPEHFTRYEQMPELGWDTVTVPGAVDVWATLSHRFGQLNFADLFKPAVQYAREGFIVSPNVALYWTNAVERYKDFPDYAACFLVAGRAPRPGEVFRCPDQADTLEEIATTHGASFYRGELARRITEYSAKTGGCLTTDDLASHKSIWEEPLSFPYEDITLHEMPPNGQGLAAMIALGILKHHELRRYSMDSADSIHLQVEAMKIAIMEAFDHIADPESMEVDPQTLLNDDVLARHAGQIDVQQARFPRTIKTTGGGTVYLTTADQTGMMVSYIQSNYIGFGSGIVIPDTGISLQNRAHGFTLEHGHPNQINGGKRPFHTIIPAFVTRNGKSLMALGVMGGHMQPQGHVQMIVRMVDYGLNPQAALDSPRWHVYEDFSLALEPGFDPMAINELQRRGHKIDGSPSPIIFGGGQIIEKLGNDGYCAASDSRKDGQAVGY